MGYDTNSPHLRASKKYDEHVYKNKHQKGNLL